MALTAPSLCPRCDAPAMITDYCIQCALQLRQCGNCQGIAGPFDRYCGFCGFEVIRGQRRSPLWRLWLLVALVPLAAGLAFGLSGTAPETVLARIAHGTGPAPSGPTVPVLHSAKLAFSYSIPHDWTASDYSQATDPTKTIPYVVASRLAADGTRAADAKGDLLQVKPQGSAVVLGRPTIDATGVDPGDPKAVLDFQVGQLLAQPPAGVRLEVDKPSRTLSINGRAAAEIVLRVTRDGQAYYFERVYFAQPAARALFRGEAISVASDWQAGDSQQVETTFQSIKFG